MVNWLQHLAYLPKYTTNDKEALGNLMIMIMIMKSMDLLLSVIYISKKTTVLHKSLIRKFKLKLIVTLFTNREREERELNLHSVR